MKKSKFIKSTIILIIGGFITKMLGMLIRIIMTRLLGTEGIGIYMLIMPTFMLFIAIANLGLPIAVSKLVAEDKKNNRNLLASTIPIILITNILIMIFLFSFAGFIADNLLHEKRTYYALISISFVLPFISISGIIRSYFFGKEKMIPHVVSNISEDLIRLGILIIGIPIFLVKGIEFAIAFIILSNVISELSSIIVLGFFLPKKIQIKKEDLKPSKNYIRDLLHIGIPTTGSRFIGSIGYFFEPILITTILLSQGVSNTYIIEEYGIINGYVMPLVLLPSFFTNAISSALIPVVSNNFVRKNNAEIKRKVKLAISFSLLIGIPSTLFFILFPTIGLNLIYNTTEGVNYLIVMAPICLFYYIQSNISSSLQAIGRAKEGMMGTLFGMILRLITLALCLYLNLKLWSLIIATGINIIFVTLFDLYKLNKFLK